MLEGSGTQVNNKLYGKHFYLTYIHFGKKKNQLKQENNFRLI